jgi:hypothetical protein
VGPWFVDSEATVWPALDEGEMTFCAKALVNEMHTSAADMHGQIKCTLGNEKLFTAAAGWLINHNFHS